MEDNKSITDQKTGKEPTKATILKEKTKEQIRLQKTTYLPDTVFLKTKYVKAILDTN